MAALRSWCFCGERAQLRREVLQPHESPAGEPCAHAGKRAPRASKLAAIGSAIRLPVDLIHS